MVSFPFSIRQVVYSSVLAFLFCANAIAQDESLQEFTDFVKDEIAKDEAVRKKNEMAGIALDLPQELAKARTTGLKSTYLLLDRLKAADSEQFPGIAAFCADLEKENAIPGRDQEIGDWGKFSVDKLTLKNPNFWKAYYEAAPGQGVMEAIYGSLLKAEGHCMRSLQVSVIARMGNRKEGTLRSYHVMNAQQNQRVASAANYRINEGIEYFEKKDFDEAGAIFLELLDTWPQCGLASFEYGLTIYHEREHKAGREVPKTAQVAKDDPSRPSDETYEYYQAARASDPMIRNAYQGDGMGKDLVVMARVILPAYRTFADFSNTQIQGHQLGLFGSGCQRIGLHDYALFTRQVFISAKNKFDPSDLEFIEKSVSELVGKETADEITEKLSKPEVALYSFKIGDGK